MLALTLSSAAVSLCWDCSDFPLAFIDIVPAALLSRKREA